MSHFGFNVLLITSDTGLELRASRFLLMATGLNDEEKTHLLKHPS